MFDLRRIAMTALPCWGFSSRLDSASAFLAYVSNEKGNSISVIDTDKMETVATIKTRQRPRGIEVSRDGKFVFVALGDDDTIQIFDTKSLDDRRTSCRPVRIPSNSRSIPAGKTLYVANENDAMVTIIDMEKRAADRPSDRRHRARGHGGQPGFQGADMHLRNHEHGAFHRHLDAADHRQSAGRFPPPLFGIQG